MLTTPTTPGSQPTPALTRRRFSAGNIFEHLTKLSAKALGSQPRRIRKKLIESRSLQRADAEFRKDFLLTHAVMEGVQKRICSLGCGFGFDDGWDPAYRRTASDRLCGKLRLPDALGLRRQSMSPRATAPAPPPSCRDVCRLNAICGRSSGRRHGRDRPRRSSTTASGTEWPSRVVHASDGRRPRWTGTG